MYAITHVATCAYPRILFDAVMMKAYNSYEVHVPIHGEVVVACISLNIYDTEDTVSNLALDNPWKSVHSPFSECP